MQKEKERLLEILRTKNIPPEIVNAFFLVHREKFVPEQVESFSYEDVALPLDDGSSISQPSTTAFMLKLLDLKENQKILEIGSGSGYVLALISKILSGTGTIYGLEINTRLAIKSKKLLEDSQEVEILNRSGFSGLPEYAPYDRILVSASCPDRRIAYKLIEQLSDSGILVIPIEQTIFRLIKENGIVREEQYPGFTFVPFKEE